MINMPWFTLELYTATPGEFTDYLKATVTKETNLKNIGRRLMSDQYNLGSRIDLQEGTTRYVNIDCLNSDGSLLYLDGYTATVLIKFSDATEINKSYTITDNTISFTIEPEDTIDKRSGAFEVRIYKDDEIFRVIKGDIGVRSSIRPFLND